jgi:hypothetical protein
MEEERHLRHRQMSSRGSQEDEIFMPRESYSGAPRETINDIADDPNEDTKVRKTLILLF